MPRLKRPITPTDYDAPWGSGDALSGDVSATEPAPARDAAYPLRCASPLRLPRRILPYHHYPIPQREPLIRIGRDRRIHRAASSDQYDFTYLSTLIEPMPMQGRWHFEMLLARIARLYSARPIICAIVCSAPGGIAHGEVASIYGGSDGHCGRLTANGEHLNCGGDDRCPSDVSVWDTCGCVASGCVVVQINDRGPFVRGRDIDLAPAAARAIGLLTNRDRHA